jgi:hypothetical protein
VKVALDGLRGDGAKGTLTFYFEDQSGRRSPAAGPAGARTLANGEGVSQPIPTGTRRVGVCFRGSDAGGPLLIVGESPAR